MSPFRLTQISDTHLTRRHTPVIENFHRVCEHIDSTRPDLVINTGDLAYDAPTNPKDLPFAKSLHAELPVPCRHIPGNHDIGDNPVTVGPAPSDLATEQQRQSFLSLIGEDRWRFDEAGWCFVGLNSLIMNTGIASEAEQFDWLAAELARTAGKPVALFIHKPLYLDAPDEPEIPDNTSRYAPQPARRRLIDMLAKVDLRLVASGHVHQRRDFTYGRVRHIWAPSTAFIFSDARQDRVALKETGLVEYRFAPDSLEVRHVRAPGQTDIDFDTLLKR
jgi:3',5'-cyclic AMP phosphodiesterase CpdA